MVNVSDIVNILYPKILVLQRKTYIQEHTDNGGGVYYPSDYIEAEPPLSITLSIT